MTEYIYIDFDRPSVQDDIHRLSSRENISRDAVLIVHWRPLTTVDRSALISFLKHNRSVKRILVLETEYTSECLSNILIPDNPPRDEIVFANSKLFSTEWLEFRAALDRSRAMKTEQEAQLHSEAVSVIAFVCLRMSHNNYRTILSYVAARAETIFVDFSRQLHPIVAQDTVDEWSNLIRTKKTKFGIDFSRLNLGDLSCTVLENAIPESNYIFSLHLGSSGITDQGCIGLANSIRKNSSLIQLSIEHNPRITSVGASALVDTLPFSTVEALDLPRNEHVRQDIIDRARALCNANKLAKKAYKMLNEEHSRKAFSISLWPFVLERLTPKPDLAYSALKIKPDVLFKFTERLSR